MGIGTGTRRAGVRGTNAKTKQVALEIRCVHGVDPVKQTANRHSALRLTASWIGKRKRLR